MVVIADEGARVKRCIYHMTSDLGWDSALQSNEGANSKPSPSSLCNPPTGSSDILSQGRAAESVHSDENCKLPQRILFTKRRKSPITSASNPDINEENAGIVDSDNSEKVFLPQRIK